jgi:hypothetical protein
VLIEAVKEPLSEEAILCPSRPQDDANASFSQSSAACDVPQYGQQPANAAMPQLTASCSSLQPCNRLTLKKSSALLCRTGAFCTRSRARSNSTPSYHSIQCIVHARPSPYLFCATRATFWYGRAECDNAMLKVVLVVSTRFG